MDSYQSFVEIFKRAASKRNFKTLIDIFNNSPRFFLFVSSENESVVHTVLDETDGLLCFLDHELKHSTRNKDFDDALKAGFCFLKFFIQNFYMTSCFKQYIHQIKDVCQLAIITKCCYYTKEHASYAFIKLIELFRNYDLDLVETIEKFVELFPVLQIRERRLTFSVLGTIIKHNEGVYLSKRYLRTIIKQIHSDLQNIDIYDDKFVAKDFYTYFNVLSEIFDSVKLSDQMKRKLRSNLFQWIKKFSNPDKFKIPRFKSVTKSAMYLLSRHTYLFQDLVYNDYKYWHNVLSQLSHEKGDFGASGQHALKAFYRLIGQMLTNMDNQRNKDICLYFMETFLGAFASSNLDLNTLRLTVYGFSQMAAACNMRLYQYNVRNMYSIVTSCSLSLCSSEQTESMHIENICCYQEALSEILCHMSDVTIEQINILIKLSIYVIKRFPDLVVSDNMIVISSLIKAIVKVGAINRNLLRRFLDNITYDGIAWSCSHTLLLDAELQQELGNLQQQPICYKNYLRLWTELLNVERYKPYRAEPLIQQVFDSLIDVCITLIGKLDLRIKRQEDSILSDIVYTQSAINQADFRIFINLVDLYVDIINHSNPFLFTNKIHRFLHEIIRLSYKYPLISGFYKLVRASLKTLNSEEMELQTKQLLSKYLVNILDLISTFSNELLITCLYLILDAPITYIRYVLPQTVPTFKIAFNMGLSNLELAYTALATLEKWTDILEQQEINVVLREIVPYLESYLRSIESTAEISQDLKIEKKVIERIDLIDTKCTLRNFQRKILLFLGSINSEILSDFMHQRSLNTGAAWDQKNLLQYTLSFPDIRLNIYFDKILPRIIMLAQSSSDRRTKIAACEVLHSMIILLIGSTVKRLSNTDYFTGLYKTLVPALLALGCDPDEVVRGLFQPLTLQLMHWLSSKCMLEFAIKHILDLLFDGLIDDLNPSVREFSGMCLAEFTRWSIKQANWKKTQPNVHRIILKINNFAVHPSGCKRIAAAVAFNHLYTILREKEEIISIYWLEIFYSFVKSLDGCDNSSIMNSLDHIEKVIRCKANILNVVRENRRKPDEFDGATLIHALHWLLLQCGVLDERCRIKCMELYINISQYTDNDNSARKIVESFIETYKIDRLNIIILKGLGSTMKDIQTNNLASLLKALQYYIWLIEKELISIATLFPSNNVKEHTIFLCIHNFFDQFSSQTMERIKKGIVMVKFREDEQLQTLQCKTLMTSLRFIQILLNYDINVLPKFLLDTPLFTLIIKCVLYPRLLGFDIRNVEMIDKLPHFLENLLNDIRVRFADNFLKSFKKCLLNSFRTYVSNLLNLQDIMYNNESCNELTQYVNGLIILEQCSMLDRSVSEMSSLAKRENTVTLIFEFLVNERIGELICIDLNLQMMEYLQTLMKLQLSQHETLVTNTLIKLIFNDTPVLDINSIKTTRGEHFLNTFKSIIYKYILTDKDVFRLIFDTLLLNNPSLLLIWIEDLLLFLKQHKHQLQSFTDNIVDKILEEFKHLENIVNNIDSRKERLINIYGIVVRLKSKLTEIAEKFTDFYKWILQQLIDNSDLEYKTYILQNFLICLIDATDSRTRALELGSIQIQILTILQSLKRSKQSLCYKISETSVNTLKVINCFETLLILLSVTKSIMILEIVIHFAADDCIGNCLFNEKLEEYIEKYFNGISSDHILSSLEVVYKLFMDLSISGDERINILRGFLLPMFKFCNIPEIERFFEKYIKNLYTISQQQVTDNDMNIKQTIVSKIGCYQLISVMFANIDLEKIVDVNSVITRNAIDNVITGRELFQSLSGSARNTRSLKISQSEYKELLRLLQCSAYNCSITIASFKEEECYYSIAFAENRTQDLLLWENIIDCSIQYKFGQTYEQDPKFRKTTINIKSINKEKQHKYPYIHSYDLSASTLNEDINAYDLNKCVLLPHPADEKQKREDMMSISLESDDLNNHECMPYICGILNHISLRKFSTRELPRWLTCFLSGMQTYKHQNIRLFMLKIISNTADTVFKHYATFMLVPVIQTVSSYLDTYNLNYIITDILEILMDWHKEAIPNEENGKKEAQNLFEVLTNKVLMDEDYDKRSIYNYNMSLIKTMIEKWCDCLEVPKSLDNKMIYAPNAAVHFILILLRNGMSEKIVSKDNIVDFFLKPLQNWDGNENTRLHSCECLGLYLRFLEGKDGTENKKREIKEKIWKILGVLKPCKYIMKQVKCILMICRTYPDIAADYMNTVIHAASVAKDLGKCCLEIFALSIPKLSAENITNNLRYIELQNVLMNKLSACEKIALQIIRSIIMIISPTDLLSYINLVIPYVKNDSTEYRDLAYDIFMNVYKKYSADISDDTMVVNLLSISLRNLLLGLLDPNPDLQKRILTFWTEETNLPEKSKDRVLTILNMDSIRTENAFPSFVALLMLHLTTKSTDYTKKIFDPLSDCNYEDYKINISWRRRNLSYMTPMFIDSLASQINYTFSQSTDCSDYKSVISPDLSNTAYVLQATRDLEFEATLIDETIDPPTSGSLLHDLEFNEMVFAKQLQAVDNKRPKRILANSMDIANIIRRRKTQENVQRTEMIKQEIARQRSNVKLYRSYRIGDFPDVKIAHSNLIEPLQQLIKLDQLVCKELIISLFCLLIEEIIENEQSNTFRENVVEILKKILKINKRDNPFNAIILEILLTLKVTDCASQDIMEVSKINDLSILGILLLEQSLIPGIQCSFSHTSNKRIRYQDNIDKDIDKWTQLASLYKSLNDVDVVLNIFRGQSFSKDLQEAALAEVNGNWFQAKNAFQGAYQQTDIPLMQEHCLQGLFEAIGNLCDWSEIDKFVKNRTNNNLDNIWQDSYKDWMITWTFDAYVHMLADGNWVSMDGDLKIIQSWMCDQKKLEYIKNIIGEDLVLFLLKGQHGVNLLNDILDEMEKRWIKLNPLSTELGICQLYKLQAINDLNASLQVLQCDALNTTDYIARMSALLKFWSVKTPSIRDNLIQWNKLAAYRTYSSMLFDDVLGNIQEDEIESHGDKNEIMHRMHGIGFQLRLDIIDAALKQKHQYIAEEHLRYLKSIACPHDLKPRLVLLKAKTEYLCADVETNILTKISKYIASWKCSHNLLNECELDVDTNIAIREHIGTMASRIEFLSKENHEFANLLIHDFDSEIIFKNIHAKSINLDSVRELLQQYSFDHLKACCDAATTNIGKHYYTLAKHCYARLVNLESVEIFKHFTLSTLRSMYHDYYEATHYFPCLLRPEQLQDKEMREIFLRESAKLQPWLFLRWQDLLFSHLSTTVAEAIISIVERIIETYPNAVVYTYHLAIKRNPAILHDGKIHQIHSLLHDKMQEINQLLIGIQYVAQPELYLKHYLNMALKELSQGEIDLETILQEVYPSICTKDNKNPRQGKIYKVIEKHEKKIRAINHKDHDAIRNCLEDIKKSLDKSLFTRPNEIELMEYSPFLYEYVGENIEIPGQYSGDRKPMPHYHVKIMKIKSTVLVMQSLRKPIRITMIGDNGKEYKFLVKFGEDLTIDRGLQQLYTTMNRTLRNDTACSQRRLAIDTYEVIPLSKLCGLIQWIEDTRSLKDMVHFTLSKAEKDRLETIHREYMVWIANATSSKYITHQYNQAILKYNQLDVTKKMNHFISETKRNALRETFIKISPSPESFVTLRRNFVTSYAAMCIAHWISGVGDRHLQNTLVTIGSGRCLGIDFGHAFGAGIRSPIPELMPFRLTPQILELLVPFTEKDLLATIMTHTMRALQDDKGPILACMDIFVHKPVNRIDDEASQDEDTNIDLMWSLKRNIEIVAKKLAGVHPSFITLEQWKETHNDDKYLARYHTIVSGEDELKQLRADMKKTDCLTSAEQVNCLLDQAKDLNILGRTYANWQPWL